MEIFTIIPSRLRLLLLGVVVFVVGAAIILFVGRQYQFNAVRVGSMPLMSQSGAREVKDGTAVAIEGVIATRAGDDTHQFVVYEREVYREEWSASRRRYDGSWHSTGRSTTPFQLNSVIGTVKIFNANYSFEDPPHLWEQGKTRYRGYMAGDRVLVVGTIFRSSGSVSLQAELLASGTRDSFLAAQRDTGTIFIVVGWVIALVGFLMLVGGVWQSVM